MRYVYAYICATCNHRAAIHGQTNENLNLYRCRECGCEMPQDGIVYELSRKEWEEWAEAYPEKVRP